MITEMDLECLRVSGFRNAAKEIEQLIKVSKVARDLQRTTPPGGVASTKHAYQIEASTVCALDAALTALDANQ